MKPLKQLCAAIADLGTSDIYTDAPEYYRRVNALHRLSALAGTFATTGKAITTEEIDAILADAAEETNATA